MLNTLKVSYDSQREQLRNFGPEAKIFHPCLRSILNLQRGLKGSRYGDEG